MICGTCWGTSACHWWVSKTSLYAKGFFVLLSFAFVSLLVFDNHGSKQWCSVCSKQAPEVDDEDQRWKLQWKNYCHVFRKHILQQDMYLIGAQKRLWLFPWEKLLPFQLDGFYFSLGWKCSLAMAVQRPKARFPVLLCDLLRSTCYLADRHVVQCLVYISRASSGFMGVQRPRLHSSSML